MMTPEIEKHFAQYLRSVGMNGSKIVAAQIKHSRSSFDTSPEALKKLQSEGVPEVVILAMFHAQKRKRA